MARAKRLNLVIEFQVSLVTLSAHVSYSAERPTSNERPAQADG